MSSQRSALQALQRKVDDIGAQTGVNPLFRSMSTRLRRRKFEVPDVIRITWNPTSPAEAAQLIRESDATGIARRQAP